MIGGCYEILNTVNGKRYIGSTVDFTKRFAQHRHKLNTHAHKNAHLQFAWIKYGIGAFEFRVLMLCERSGTLFWEQRYLDEFKPEYNIASSATAPMLGRKFSDDHKGKIAKANTGKISPFLGKKHTLETRALMSKNMRGIPKSPEHCVKIGARTLGTVRPPELRDRISGKLRGVKKAPLSDSHREKIAEANRGKKQSAETKRKRSVSMVGNTNSLGYKHSDESKAKISRALKGRKGKPLSVEARRKISERQKGKPKPPFTAEHRANLSKAARNRKRAA